MFFSQWEELLRLRKVAIITSDPDDIHDLRVASRRFRAVLELFYPFVPKGAKTELRKSVRMLTRILGGLRNVDEARLFFAARMKTDISAGDKLFHRLSGQRSSELKLISQVLKEFDHRALDRIVRKIVAGVNEHSFTSRNSISLLAYFSDVSIRQYLPIHHLLTVSTAPEQRASRHALRIAIKKWRYFFELISQILDREYTSFLELLKDYQSLLGRMNDIAEFENLLRKLILPPDERDHIAVTLLAEDAILLGDFTALIEHKPLVYTFLI